MTTPGGAVHPGDVLTIAFPKTIKVLRIVDFAERRGNSIAAHQLYEEVAPANPHPRAIPPELLAKRKSVR